MTIQLQAQAPAPGTLGIGVGNLLQGIPERGEPEVVFHSVVWFPYAEAKAAQEFADENEMHLREGVAL